MVRLNLEALPKKGEVVLVKVRGAMFEATVLDARFRYGQIDALVAPVTGTGNFWASYENLKRNVATSLSQAEAGLAEEVTDEELEKEATLIEE